MPLRIGSRPDRRERLLAFAGELVDEIEILDLDTIDGEFYWRCCRTDLLTRIEGLCGGLRLVGAYKPEQPARSPRWDSDALAGWIEPEGVFDYLREGLRFAHDVMSVAEDATRLFPRVVWQRLLDGERVAMRAAEATIHFEDGGRVDLPVFRLKVFSGA